MIHDFSTCTNNIINKGECKGETGVLGVRVRESGDEGIHHT